MSKTMKKALQAIFLLLILVYFSARLYFHHRLPVYEGTLELSGLKDTVEVYTDSYGVPHIFAENEDDLFFAAGYVAARERLFQMTTVAAAVRGELALLFGDDQLEDDIYLRTWGIPQLAIELAQRLDPDSRRIVEAFCRGINTYVDDLGDDLPVEFKILRTKPLHWTPSDVTGYSRLMAHDLQQSWKLELVFGSVREYFGEQKLAELLPAYSPDQPRIYRTAEKSVFTRTYAALWERERSLRDLTGSWGQAIGSNNWVLAGSRTTTGKPILANDPHLGFEQPAKWYEMHLKGGRYNVSGVCLAGIPVPVIGQNDSCAWGFTNMMVDDIDFFVETINPENPNQYRWGDEWREMEIIRETVPLRDGRDTTVIIRKTHHGPIISDIHPLLRQSDQVISMSWMGSKMSAEVPALIRLARIKGWEDFSKAVSGFGVPGQNMVYADVQGNIGWRPAGYLPIRKDGSSLVPRPGDDPDYDWQGVVPFEEMPFLFNPPRGAIVSANNKTIDSTFPYYVSNLWADPSRAMRINELVDQQERLSVDDVKSIQTDQVSPYARAVVPYFLAAATGGETGNLKRALDLLRAWDGNEESGSGAALVFQVALNKLFHNVYSDEFALLGEPFLEGFLQMPMIPSRNLLWLLQKNSSSWFDDITTPDYVETRDDILLTSLQEAVAEIEQRVGMNPSTWTWGKVHTVTHRHPLGRVKILDWVFGFNVGPFPSGGSSWTVNNGEYSLNHPYDQIVGPSMRRIVDFSDLNRTQMILPTGESGLPNSPHYRDQASLYMEGNYRTTAFDEASIRTREDFKRLLLLPVQ